VERLNKKGRKIQFFRLFFKMVERFGYNRNNRAHGAFIVAGVMAIHPFTWKTELRKMEYSMFKEISNTRSWGNRDIFQYALVGSQKGRAHHAKK
jgi:hypothetical protein